MSIYVPKEIIFELEEFVLFNRARHENRSLSAPIMLALEGPSGSGKTTAIRAFCQHYNMPLEFVPASSLGGAYAGQSSMPVYEAIIRAASTDAMLGGAVLIDDLDLTEARIDDKLSGTINNVLLNATFMAYADNPFLLKINEDPDKPVREEPLKRPPVIFVSCNDSSKLYDPLRRDGRMQRVVYDPRGEDLRKIISGMYPGLKRDECADLAQTFPEASVAFFKELGRRSSSGFIRNIAETKQPHNNPEFDFKAFAASLADAMASPSLGDLKTIGQRLIATAEGKSYLRAAA